MRAARALLAAGGLLAAAFLTACSSHQDRPAQLPPTRVLAVVLSKHAAPRDSMPAGEGLFEPTDTVYVSVRTHGGEGGLTVTWIREGAQAIDATSANSTAGGGVTTFRHAPPHGWAKGRYLVEVALRGALEQRCDFTVP